jgi:hypothetical protein
VLVSARGKLVWFCYCAKRLHNRNFRQQNMDTTVVCRTTGAIFNYLQMQHIAVKDLSIHL